MKIGIYIENYRAGGLDRVAIDLINHWPSDLDQFVFFCNNTHAGLPIIKQNIKRKVRYVIYPTSIFMRLYNRLLKLRMFHQINRIFYNMIGCYLAMLWEVPHLMYLFKKNKLDMLIIHNGGWPAARSVRSAAIAGRLKGIKTTIIIHGLASRHHFAVAFQERCLERLLSRMGVDVVAISNATKECLEKFTQLPSATVIYNGIRELANELPLSENKDDLRSELDLDSDTFLVGMFGTYAPFRGHEFMINVMKRVLKDVPKANLLVVGTGNSLERDSVKQYISESGLQENVRLLGFRTDVARIMTSLNVVVQPIQSRASFGLLIVEAMALKKPVVASSIGGILEIIEDGKTGFLASPTDLESFAQSLICLAGDQELCKKMGQAGFARYNRYFHANRMAHNYHSYIS